MAEDSVEQPRQELTKDRREQLLSNAAKKNPYLRVFKFFATGERDATIAQTIAECGVIKSWLLPQGVMLDVPKLEFAESLDLSSLTNEELAAVTEELTLGRQAIRQEYRLITDSDPQLQALLKEYHSLTHNIEHLTKQNRRRPYSSQEAELIAEQQVAQSMGFGSVQALRTAERIPTSTTDPGVVRDAGRRIGRISQFLEGEQSPYSANHRQQQLEALFHHMERVNVENTERIFRELIDMGGKIYYYPADWNDRGSLPAIDKNNIVQIAASYEQETREPNPGKLQVKLKLAGAGEIDDICTDPFAWDGRTINYRPDYCLKLGHLREMTHRLAQDANVVNDKVKIRKIAQLWAEMEILEHIDSLFTYPDFQSPSQNGQKFNPDNPDNPFNKYADKNTERCDDYFSDPTTILLQWPNQENRPISNRDIILYANSRILLQGEQGFRQRGKYTYDEYGLVQPITRRSEKLKSYLASLPQSFQAAVADRLQVATEKLIGTPGPNSGQRGIGELLSNLAQLYTSPDFVILANPNLCSHTLEQINYLSALPRDKALAFQEYLLPEKCITPEYGAVRVIGRAVIQTEDILEHGINQKIIPVFAPAHCRLRTLKLEDGEKRLDLHYGRDFLLDFEEKTGCYRIRFTQQGIIATQGIKQFRYSYSFDPFEKAATVPQREPFLAVEHITQLTSCIEQLTEIGFTKVAQNLSQLLAEGRPITTNDIRKAVLDGSYYSTRSFPHDRMIQPEALDNLTDLLPPPTEAGEFAGVCADGAFLSAAILNTILGEEKHAYPSLILNTVSLGYGIKFCGLPHSDTRIRGDDNKEVVHETTPPKRLNTLIDIVQELIPSSSLFRKKPKSEIRLTAREQTAAPFTKERTLTLTEKQAAIGILANNLTTAFWRDQGIADPDHDPRALRITIPPGIAEAVGIIIETQRQLPYLNGDQYRQVLLEKINAIERRWQGVDEVDVEDRDDIADLTDEEIIVRKLERARTKGVYRQAAHRYADGGRDFSSLILKNLAELKKYLK